MPNQDVKFEIQEKKEVNQILDSLPKNISNKVLLDISKGAAKIVQQELKQSVPDGDNNKASKDKAENNVVIKKGKKNNVFIGFTKRAFHVKFLEVGVNVMRKKKSGAETGTF
jgi:hypothetical protein